MTKKELIKRLSQFPDNMKVVLFTSEDDFTYTLAEDVSLVEVEFRENSLPPKEWVKEKCILISEV